MVARFDDARGDGDVLGDDGCHYYFHCVAIADGTRTIEEAARVVGRRAVGRLGRDELVDLVETPRS